MRIFFSLLLLFGLVACSETTTTQAENDMSKMRVVIGKLVNVNTDYTPSTQKDKDGDDIDVCGASIATFEVFTKDSQHATTVKLKQKLDEDCENSFYDMINYTKYQIIFFNGQPDSGGIIEVSNSYVDDKNPFYLFNIYQSNGQIYADISDENIYIEFRDPDPDIDEVIIDASPNTNLLSLDTLLANANLTDHIDVLSTPTKAGLWYPEIYAPKTFEDVNDTYYRSLDQDGKTIALNRALILNTAFPNITEYMLDNENIPLQ